MKFFCHQVQQKQIYKAKSTGNHRKHSCTLPHDFVVIFCLFRLCMCVCMNYWSTCHLWLYDAVSSKRWNNRESYRDRKKNNVTKQTSHFGSAELLLCRNFCVTQTVTFIFFYFPVGIAVAVHLLSADLRIHSSAAEWNNPNVSPGAPMLVITSVTEWIII